MQNHLLYVCSVLVGICSILVFHEQALYLVTGASITLTSLFSSARNLVATFTTTSPAEKNIAVDPLSSSSSLQENQPEEQPATLPFYNPTEPVPTVNAMSASRLIRKVILAVEQAEGAGARVRRSIGTPQLRHFTPFLMLDHFSIKPGAGFPDHPHRGQETITYLLQGGVDHEDFAGNKGTLGPGDLQFMTAGRGIVHAEMPRQNLDGSANVGLQLWVDLPKHLKMCEPRYRDLRANEIPTVDVDDGKVHVKVISGQSHGVDSIKDLAYTPVWILDIEIQPGGKIVQPLPKGYSAFMYTLEGKVILGKEGEEQRVVELFHNVVFESEGDAVFAHVDGGEEKGARFVLIAGQPMDQKIVQYGPFVLNSQEEVYQAFVDYQTHANGFERARGWESEIGKSMVH